MLIYNEKKESDLSLSIKGHNIKKLHNVLCKEIIDNIEDKDNYDNFLRDVKNAIYAKNTKEVRYIIQYFSIYLSKNNKVNNDIFAMALNADQCSLAKWMLQYKFIKQENNKPLNILSNILNFSGGGIRGFKNPTNKEKIIKYFLRYDFVKKELKNTSIYNYIVSRSHNSSILEIVINEIKDKPHFKKCWKIICIYLAQYDYLNKLIELKNKNYFPMNYKLWKNIFIQNLNSHEIEIIEYFNKPEFQSIIQKTINAKNDNKTLWFTDKMIKLENLEYNFLSANFYYKVMELQDYYKERYSNRGIDADILLDELKDRFLESPEEILKLDIDKVAPNHRKVFNNAKENVHLFQNLEEKISEKTIVIKEKKKKKL